MRAPKRVRGVYFHKGAWWVHYYADGRRHRERAGTRPQAIALYQQRKAVAGSGAPLTVSAVLTAYLHARRSRSSYTEMARYAAQWEDRLGTRLVTALRLFDVTRIYHERRREAPVAANREASFLRAALRWAKTQQLLTTTPFDQGLRLERESDGRVRYASQDEEERLCANLDPLDWSLVQFALSTGLRRGEQFGLLWKHVNRTQRVIRLPRSKSGSARALPVNTTALEVLDRWTGRHPERVFPVNAKNFVRRVFVPALDDAGIADFRWHDLRHTFASRLVMRGVPLTAVQQLLGHRTLAMTLRYAHLAPGFLHDAVAVLVAVPPPEPALSAHADTSQRAEHAAF
jgi:integrase